MRSQNGGGAGGVGSGARTSWLAPHGAKQPSCSALPGPGRQHPTSPDAARTAPARRLGWWREPALPPHPEVAKRPGKQAPTSQGHQGSRERNIWEDSTLHLQKKPRES